MSKRMKPESSVLTSTGTLLRLPPGWPLCRWFSVRSIIWSTTSAITSKWGTHASNCAAVGSTRGRWATGARAGVVGVMRVRREKGPAIINAELRSRTMDGTDEESGASAAAPRVFGPARAAGDAAALGLGAVVGH